MAAHGGTVRMAGTTVRYEYLVDGSEVHHNKVTGPSAGQGNSTGLSIFNSSFFYTSIGFHCYIVVAIPCCVERGYTTSYYSTYWTAV